MTILSNFYTYYFVSYPTCRKLSQRISKPFFIGLRVVSLVNGFDYRSDATINIPNGREEEDGDEHLG